jgi:type I restriction enzyme S subunit
LTLDAWTTHRLKTLTTKIGSGITPKGGSSTYRKSGVVFFRSQNVLDSRLLLEDVAYISVEQHNLMSSTVVHHLDVLLTITGNFRACVVPIGFPPANVSQHVCIVRCNSDLNPHFLCYYLNSFDGRRSIWQAKSGGTREGLNFNQIGRFVIPLPPLPEQKAIAAILSTWDRAIEQVTKLIEAKTRLKKGLMQQLLTGKKRFKEFKGEWRHTKISEIVSEKKGGIKIGPFGSQLKREEFVESGYKVYDQETTFRNDFGYGNSYISQSKFDSLKSNTVLPGDVIVSMMGTIGAASVVPNDAQQGIINSHLIRLSPNTRIITSQFLQTSITQSPLCISQMRSKSQGGIMAGLSVGILKTVELLLPSLDEQAAVVKVSDTISRDLELLDQRLDALKKQKKGLMQVLLTGKVRVKVNSTGANAKKATKGGKQ